MMNIILIPKAMQSSAEDPRVGSGFEPQFYPSANGKNAPPADATERNDRITLEFLAAYYTINQDYARFLEVRTKSDSPERCAAERERLQAIESALIHRDGLEDRYAPFGVIAEPVIKEGFTVNLKISFGNVDAEGRRRSQVRTYKMTAYIPIPLPDGVRIEDLPLQIDDSGIGMPGTA